MHLCPSYLIYFIISKTATKKNHRHNRVGLTRRLNDFMKTFSIERQLNLDRMFIDFSNFLAFDFVSKQQV